MNSGMICPRYTLLMKTRSTPKLAALCAFAALAGLMPLGPAHAGKGTISAVNRKCVSISTPAGFVLVRGWINAPVGTTVEGPFDVFGRVPIFDQDGKLLDTWYQFSRISGIHIAADDTLYAIAQGIVSFQDKKVRRYTGAFKTVKYANVKPVETK